MTEAARAFGMLGLTGLLAAAAPGHASVDCVAWPDAVTGEGPPGLSALAREVAALSGRYGFIAEALDRTRPALCLSDEISNAHGFYDVDENRIAVDADLPAEFQIAIVVHELRHLWQFGMGNCPSSDLAMDQYGLGTLALEADASAISLLIAWEIRMGGRDGVWASLAAWPTQSDVAKAFADEMSVAAIPAHAVSAAFGQWYASERRVRDYYFSACSGYLDRQDDEKLLPGYDALPADYYTALCVMPDGRPYDCAPPPDLDP
jgi:hypothetical protein